MNCPGLTAFLGHLESLAAQKSTQITYHKVDVTNADHVNAFFAVTMPILRHPLRGVVTCAGVGRGKAAIDFEASEFRRTLDVNIMGTFLVAQAAAREMRKRSLGGSLVLVASMGGSVSLKVSIGRKSLQGQGL